jgi:hypothetical protein
MEQASDHRIAVGNQSESLANATIDIYEYGTNSVILRVSVVSIIDDETYLSYLAKPKTIIILPDHLQFAKLVEKLNGPKCAGKYVAGQSKVYDALMDTPIADNEDFNAAVRYQFLTHKVKSIVLEVQTPTAVTISVPGITGVRLQSHSHKILTCRSGARSTTASHDAHPFNTDQKVETQTCQVKRREQ